MCVVMYVWSGWNERKFDKDMWMELTEKSDTQMWERTRVWKDTITIMVRNIVAIVSRRERVCMTMLVLTGVQSN